MRIEQLEYVQAVARHGSFRSAAEELHISQPALSEAVRRLEAEFGVKLLDRRSSGSTISDDGRRLLPHMLDVTEAASRLRRVAGHQPDEAGTVRLGTVTAATAPLLTPTLRVFRERHPATQIEVETTRQIQIHQALLDGSMDLGLVNYLDSDQIPGEFETTELLRGRPVICIRSDSPLASKPAVRLPDLDGEPLIAMRPGYVMHRYLHRLLDGRTPAVSFAADGAEMGKQMVAAGLGVALLPDYSVVGDPLQVRGEITCREIEDDETEVTLVLQRRRSVSHGGAVDDLHRLFVRNAGTAQLAAA